MKKDIKARWTAALRSGEYEQGKGELRTESDSYCCLGVLCDIAEKDGVGRWESSDELGWVFRTFSGGNSVVLPLEVCGWAGVTEGNNGGMGDAVVVSNGLEIGLTALNDKGTSFHEIADLIEEQL